MRRLLTLGAMLLCCSRSNPPPSRDVPTPTGFVGDRIATGGDASRMVLARVTADGGLQARVLASGQWDDWHDLGNPHLTSGVAIGQFEGYSTVFGRTDRGLGAVTYETKTGWGGFYDLGNPPIAAVASPPSVVTEASGYTTVFVRGTDDALWSKGFDAKTSTWGSWVSLGGTIGSAPAAWIEGDRVNIVASDAATGAFTIRSRSADGTWGAWLSATPIEPIVSAPAVVHVGDLVWLVAPSSRGSLQAATVVSGVWTTTVLGGSTASTPAVAASDASASLFARDSETGLLSQLTFDGKAWGAWQTRPEWAGLVLAEPPAAFATGNTLRVYGADANGAPTESVGDPAWHPWASVAASATQAAPGTVTGPISNPGMGWMLEEFAYFTGHAGDASDGRSPDPVFYPGAMCRDFDWKLVDTVELIESWSWIQRGGPDSFDWTRLDNMLDFWVKKGKRISLRVNTDDIGCYEPMFAGGGPSSRMPDRAGCAGPPRWIWDQVAKFSYYDEDALWEFPDYASPIYLAALGKFVQRYAERYGNDPNVDLVDLHSYGEWGEWHSSEDEHAQAPPYQFGADDEVRKKTLGAIVEMWSTAFPKKILPLSGSYEYRSPTTRWNVSEIKQRDPSGIPSPYDYYREISAFDVAFAKPNVTVRRDGYDGFSENTIFSQFDGRLIRTEGFGNDAKKVPAVAEFKLDYFGATHDDDGTPHDRVSALLQQVLDYHNNYAMILGWGCSPAPIGFDAKTFYTADQGRFASMLQAGGLGYRFELTSASFPHEVDATSSSFSVTTTWRNSAVGRAINRWSFGFYLVSTRDHSVVAWTGKLEPAEDVRDWVGSQLHTVTATFGPGAWSKPPPGEYRLMVAFIDPSTDRPAVTLAVPESEGKLAPLGVLYVR